MHHLFISSPNDEISYGGNTRIFLDDQEMRGVKSLTIKFEALEETIVTVEYAVKLENISILVEDVKNGTEELPAPTP